MVLLTTDYNNITGAIPCIRPKDPCTFSPTTTTTSGVSTRAFSVSYLIVVPTLTVAEITTQMYDYDERLCLFKECKTIEVLLHTQTIEAIDSHCLEALYDTVTDIITSSIPDIFTYFLNHGYLLPIQ